MTNSTTKFNFTASSPEFNIVVSLEKYLWKFVNKNDIISIFNELDDVAYKAVSSLLKFVDDGAMTVRKLANDIVSGNWDLA